MCPRENNEKVLEIKHDLHRVVRHKIRAGNLYMYIHTVHEDHDPCNVTLVSWLVM